MTTLCGCVSLAITPSHRRAELGYWLGVPYWNQGYTTEAAAALIGYGFEQIQLNRVAAEHLSRNPASGRVMEKLGMTHEGTLRQRVIKDGVFEDLEVYGLLADQWRRQGLTNGIPIRDCDSTLPTLQG